MLEQLAITLSYIEKQFFLGRFASIFRFESKTVVKRPKQICDFRDFRYRYALLQKIKNVLTYYEYIFDFLKECVPITEIPEIPFPFQDFH